MATVWTFGDSLTERYNPKIDWAEKYIEFKGYHPKVYGNFISENLNYDLQNLGKCGCDNYTIFETFCKTYPLIKDGDIIIFGWTSCLRFRMVNEDNNWQSILPYYENRLIHFNLLSENTINEILINRSNTPYVDELNNKIDFINTICNNKKVIHWTNFHTDLNAFFFAEHIQKIRDETFNKIDDSHFSENGHMRLSKDILYIIENNIPFETNKKLI
jgi:lysophospholipase L1-like esterase